MRRNITYIEQVEVGCGDNGNKDLELLLRRLKDPEFGWGEEKLKCPWYPLSYLPPGFGGEEVIAKARYLPQMDISVEVSVAREGEGLNTLTIKLSAEYLAEDPDWYPACIQDLVAGTGLKLE